MIHFPLACRFLNLRVTCVLLIVVQFVGWIQASTTVTNEYSGMVRHSVSRSLNGRTVNYEVVVINMLDPGISFYLTPDNGALSYETTKKTTKTFAATYGTELAINAHFFSSFSFSSQADNIGIAASNGTVYSAFEKTNAGHTVGLNISQTNFAETVEGADGGTTFTSTTTPPWTTLGPIPLLYRSGVIVNNGAADQRARTQIGIKRGGSEVMLFACSSQMTERECADILLNDFKAWDVYGLDGGGSTGMVLRTGTTTQSIIARETAGNEREVGTNLGVQAAPYAGVVPDLMDWDAAPATPGIQQGSGVWNFSTTNWQASGTNRIWRNPKTPVFGSGSGGLISLGGRMAATDLSVAGGYTFGTGGGSALTLMGNLTTTGSQPTTINAPLGESTSFTKRGAATLMLGTASRIFMLNVDEGTVDLGGQGFSLLDPVTPMTLRGGRVQSGSLTFTAKTSELAAPSGATVLDVNLNATQLNKTGGGTVELLGVNTWTGTLQVAGGTLKLGGASNLPATPLLISSGLLDLNGVSASISTLKLGGVVGGVASVATGTGTLTLGGTLTYDATNDPGGAMVSGTLDLGANRTFFVGDSAGALADLTVLAAITGNYTLSKTGAGRLVLAGGNSFSVLTISDGTVRSGADDVLPDGSLNVNNGVLDLGGFTETVGALKMGGVVGFAQIQTGTGTLTLGSNFTYSASGNGSGALITGNLDLGVATRSFTIGDSGNADSDTRIDAAITGGAGMTKAGVGRLDLAGPVNLAGTMTVNSGEMRLVGGNVTLGAVTMGGVANVLPILNTGTATLTVGGTLTYSASGNGLGSVMRGRVDFGNSLRTLTVNNSTNAMADLRIEAEIAGSGGFVKGGTGTLELAGSNTLTGPISCSAGVLALAHASALGSASSVTLSGTSVLDASVLALGTLSVNRAALTVGGVGTITGNIALSAGKLSSPGSGQLAISGDLGISGGTTEVKVGIGAGGIIVGGNATLGGTLAVTMGGSLSGTQTVSLITAASVSGSFAAVQLPPPPVGTAYSISVTSTQVLLRVAPATPVQSWLASQMLPMGTALDQDLDGDGQSLLVEYGLGGSALAPDPTLTRASLGGPSNTALTISFLWNSAATDLDCLVRSSPNLVDWITVLRKTGGGPWSGTASYTQGTAVNGLVSVTVTDPGTGEPRFLRLEITKP